MTRSPVALPSDDRRVLVHAFWLTVSSILILPWFVLALLAYDIAPAVVGAAFASLAAYVALAREGLPWRVYRAWNRRIVRPFASASSAVVLAICYSVVVIAARVPARQDAITEPRSSWVSRRSLPIDAYHALFAGARADAVSTGWIRNYVRWAGRTNNLWATSLLPFLVLLKLLSDDELQAPHANIYTLF